MKSKVESYYQEEYFEKFQKKIGEFGGKANLFKFEEFINEKDVVLDFGCGGGFLLKEINCFGKIGVELNPIARKYCFEVNQIECFESIDGIQDESIDIIISNHCLEHTESPFSLILKMYKKLKFGGKIVLVVPLEGTNFAWKPNDVNNHLYSFSPMNLGNLLQGCSFNKIKSEIIYHKWPPYFIQIEKYFGFRLFNILCYLYGRINKNWFQVRGVAVK